MAKLVSKNQRLVTGVVNPTSSYSRVVGCTAFIKAPATQGFMVTATLGQMIRLLRVQVWFDPRVWSVNESLQWRIVWGQKVPGSYAEIQRWEDVIPMYGVGGAYGLFTRVQYFDPLEFQMSRLFKGEAIRFGILIDVNPTVTVLYGYAAFQISEG